MQLLVFLCNFQKVQRFTVFLSYFPGKTLQYFLNPTEDEVSVFEKCTNEVFADVIEQRRDVMASKLKYRGTCINFL